MARTQPRVGDAFYTFTREMFGSGHELEKRWIYKEDGHGGFRHRGGAVDASTEGKNWPWGGHPVPEKAFAIGKKRAIKGLEAEKKKLRDKLAELVEETRKLRKLKFEDVKIRDKDRTFRQMMDDWENDLY